MFLPSRPMIRPFMSSLGSSTIETVVSAAWLAATRCSASATRFRARRFASARASSSSCRTRRASSCRTSSSERSSRYVRASGCVMPASFSSTCCSCSFARFSSSCSSFDASSRSFTPCSRRDSSVSLRSRSSSSVAIRSSVRPISERRVRTSSSIWARRVSSRSRVSICASRRIASASRSASVIRSVRRRRSSPSRLFSSIAIVTTAAATPTTIPIAIPATTSNVPAPRRPSSVVSPPGSDRHRGSEVGEGGSTPPRRDASASPSVGCSARSLGVVQKPLDRSNVRECSVSDQRKMPVCRKNVG